MVYISLASVYKIRDTETRVVKQKLFTMLTGTLEKKWKENEVWQLRGWFEDLVGFPHDVLSAADCRADGKELDFKQCTNYEIEEIVSLLYYLKTVYKEQLCLGPVTWQELACNCSRKFQMENTAKKTACSSTPWLTKQTPLLWLLNHPMVDTSPTLDITLPGIVLTALFFGPYNTQHFK